MLELLGGGATAAVAVAGGERGLNRVKPGLLFLLRLAWESRARLPLLIMSGFMALGVRVQMEINIDRAVRFMPRLRLEDEAGGGGVLTDTEEEWTEEEEEEEEEEEGFTLFGSGSEQEEDEDEEELSDDDEEEFEEMQLYRP